MFSAGYTKHRQSQALEIVNDQSIIMICFGYDFMDYLGNDVYSYKIATCKKMPDQPEEVIEKKYDNQTQEDFEHDKESSKTTFLDRNIDDGDYSIVCDTDSLLILQSSIYKVRQYYCDFDTVYSDFLGDAKHQIITLIITEDRHNSNRYEVSGILGLKNLHDFLSD